MKKSNNFLIGFLLSTILIPDSYAYTTCSFSLPSPSVIGISVLESYTNLTHDGTVLDFQTWRQEVNAAGYTRERAGFYFVYNGVGYSWHGYTKGIYSDDPTRWVYVVNNCPTPPDSDNDGTPDKDDIDTKDPSKIDLGLDPKNCDINKNQNTVANPINIFNGNNLEQKIDLSFNSPFENGLLFKRFYNSQSTEDSTMGFGWTHNYNFVLRPNFGDSEQLIEIIEGTGRGIYFDDNDQDGIFKGAFTENSSIIIDNGNDYIWTRDDGTICTFNSTGQFTSITDKNGNVQQLAYNTDNLVETVTDQATGKSIAFYYNANNKIAYISGPVTLAVPDGIWVS